jgi:tagatose 6-phosphate kinase
MILTVTLNPALDLTYTVPELKRHAVCRVSDVRVQPGGKGLNVARVLRSMGTPVLATGLLGGSTGEQVRCLLEDKAVLHRFAPIEGDTRRTVVVADKPGVTSLWEPGPMVTDKEWAAFLALFNGLSASAATVVLAGSLPQGLPPDAYATLIDMAHANGALTVLDADGLALRHGLKAGPAVVKPNAAELAAATGLSIETPSGAAQAAQLLRADGARTVVSSLGSSGLIVSTTEQTLHARPPRSLNGNPTGAGDAAVAAIANGITRGAGWSDIATDAVAFSAAAVVASTAGEVCFDTARDIRPHITVNQLPGV